MDEYKIAAVILNYRTWNDAIECVDSLLKMDYSNYAVVIVENGSDNDSYERLRKQFNQEEKVHILKSEVNLGFARGNNLGIKYAHEKLKADFVYVANSDTVITKASFFHEIVDVYRPGIGAISPTLYKLDGSYHMPAVNSDHIYKEAALALTGVAFSYFFYSNVKKRKAKKARKRPAQKTGTLPENKEWKSSVLHGSAYFLTPDFFEHYECLYPRTFLYWEEINLLLYLKKARLQSILAETSIVIHKINGSTNTVFREDERKRLHMSLKSSLRSVRMFFMSSAAIRRRFSD